MIPETLGALLAFGAFIVPGLAFELLRERRRPVIEETAFREASRIALTSILFTSAAVVVVSGIRAVNSTWIIDPAQWLREGQAYPQNNLFLVAATLILVMAVSTLFALVVDWFFRRSVPGRIVPGSIWYSVFRHHRPEGAKPWVHLRLSDDTEVWGFAGDYTPDHSLENRELLVEGPKLQYRRKGKDVNTLLTNWSFLSVRGDEITWMKVQYVKDGKDSGDPEILPAKRVGPWRRSWSNR